MGATLRSFATSASDQSGLVNDPMAMKAFCGYNIKTYFSHWLSMEERARERVRESTGKSTGEHNLPKIYHVNWFQKDENGRFLWPGFGENARVLEWIFRRGQGRAKGVETPIGTIPDMKSFNTSGLSLSPAALSRLFSIDNSLWLHEAEAARIYFTKTLETEKDKTKVPRALYDELNSLVFRLVK